jgi:hypothetical protein
MISILPMSREEPRFGELFMRSPAVFRQHSQGQCRAKQARQWQAYSHLAVAKSPAVASMVKHTRFAHLADHPHSSAIEFACQELVDTGESHIHA